MTPPRKENPVPIIENRNRIRIGGGGAAAAAPRWRPTTHPR